MICWQIPEVSNLLKSKNGGPDRPRLERDQPDLDKLIVDIGIYGSGAEEHRRSNMIRSCTSLDNLKTHEKCTSLK